jgi:hypothetical protein
MKHYLLDEPLAAAPLPPAGPPALSLTQPGWWRWLVLAIVLEAVALAVLYVALNGVPGASSAEPTRGIAYVASFSFPRDPESARSPAQPTEAPVSRVRQERGRYLVELHDEVPEQALAMLAEATKSRVAGANIFAGSPLRVTRSAVAATPREAWQAVFGDVANFVVACTGNACEVRFVSLVKPEAQLAGRGPLQRAVSPIPPPAAPAPPGRTLDGEGVVQD